MLAGKRGRGLEDAPAFDAKRARASVESVASRLSRLEVGRQRAAKRVKCLDQQERPFVIFCGDALDAPESEGGGGGDAGLSRRERRRKVSLAVVIRAMERAALDKAALGSMSAAELCRQVILYAGGAGAPTGSYGCLGRAPRALDMISERPSAWPGGDEEALFDVNEQTAREFLQRLCRIASASRIYVASASGKIWRVRFEGAAEKDRPRGSHDIAEDPDAGDMVLEEVTDPGEGGGSPAAWRCAEPPPAECPRAAGPEPGDSVAEDGLIIEELDGDDGDAGDG